MHKLPSATFSPSSPSGIGSPEVSTAGADLPPLSTKLSKQPKPSQVAPIKLDSSTNNNDTQSRSKGANSADLSIDPLQPKRQHGSFQAPPFSPERLEQEFKQRLENDTFDAATRTSLAGELKMLQTYANEEDKDLKVALDLFHKYDTKQLKVKELDLNYLSPHLTDSSILHGGENGDVLVTCTCRS